MHRDGRYEPPEPLSASEAVEAVEVDRRTKDADENTGGASVPVDQLTRCIPVEKAFLPLLEALTEQAS